MARHFLRGLVVCVSCAAVVSAAKRSPSRLAKPVVLTVAMADACRAPGGAIVLAQTESTRVWSRSGVTIRWVAPSELPYESSPSEWLVVRCADRETPVADAEVVPQILPIATIRFVAERPTNTIMLNVGNAYTLLQRDAPQPSGARAGFIPLRDTRLGRMLGRAIAHEIGHFLTQSGAHTRTGLMRASHTVAALTGASLGPFRAPDSSHY